MRTFSEASRCILSKFYIKPQPFVPAVTVKVGCILSKFYIKPQLYQSCIHADLCCILSKFYIKPQPFFTSSCSASVVSYRNSTSNHNCLTHRCLLPRVVSYRNSTSNHNSSPTVVGSTVVVSYRNSTSNHNAQRTTRDCRPVVSYRNSTSNHNISFGCLLANTLYLIEILHQTTTQTLPVIWHIVLYLIEIQL